jgi:hypothetical protein
MTEEKPHSDNQDSTPHKRTTSFDLDRQAAAMRTLRGNPATGAATAESALAESIVPGASPESDAARAPDSESTPPAAPREPRASIAPTTRAPAKPRAFAESHEAAETIPIWSLTCYRRGQMLGRHPILTSARDQELSIGTDPACDIVLSLNEGISVEPVHAEIVPFENPPYINSVGGHVVVMRDGRVAAESSTGGYSHLQEGDHLIIGAPAPIDDLNDLPQLRLEVADCGREVVQTYLNQEIEELIRVYGENLMQVLIHVGTPEASRLIPHIQKSSDHIRNFLSFAQQKQIEISTPEDMNRLLETALAPVREELETRIARAINVLGIILTEKIENNPEAIAQINRSFVESADECRAHLEEIELLERFARDHGIQIFAGHGDGNDIETLIRKQQAYLELQKEQLEGRRIAEGIAQRAKEQLPENIHYRTLDRLRQQYAGVHVALGEFIDETTGLLTGKMIHVNINGTEQWFPLMSRKITIGEHETSMIRIPAESTDIYSSRPFIAEIHVDELFRTYRLHWLTGNLKNTYGQTFALPTITLSPNEPVSLESARTSLEIAVETDHACTEQYACQEAQRTAIEMLETILHRESASEEMIIEATKTLKNLLESKIVGRDILDTRLDPAVAQMMKNMESWRIDISSQDASLQDAKQFHVIKILQKILQLELDPAYMQNEAARRAMSYAEADAKACKPPGMGQRLHAAIRPNSRAVRALEEARRENSQKAGIGAVQIARLLEIGCISLNELDAMPGIRLDYADKIKEIRNIRNRIKSLQYSGPNIIEIYTRLSAAVEGKSAEDIFSCDEIAAMNPNAGFSIHSGYPMNEYLQTLMIITARNFFREAILSEDTTEQVTALNRLLESGVVSGRDLVAPPCLDLQSVKSKLEELRRRAEQKLAAHETLEATATERHAEIMTKLALARQVADAISRAREQQSLKALLPISAIISDPLLAEALESESIQMKNIKVSRASDAPRGYEALNGTRQAQALLPVRVDVTMHKWTDVQRLYRELALSLGTKAAREIKRGTSATANANTVLLAAHEHGLFTLNEIGLTDDDITRGKTLEKQLAHEQTCKEKYRPLYEEALASALDDMAYLANYDALSGIANTAEREILHDLLDLVSVQKTSRILGNLRAAKDVRYMKMLAEEIIAKGFNPETFFPDPADIALLQ